MELKQYEQMTEEQSVSTDVDTAREETYGGWENTDEVPYVAPNLRLISQTEFYRRPVMHTARTNITISAIMLYISSASNLLINMTLGHGLLYSIDSFIVLGLALGIHLRRSRGCAVAMAIYAGLNVIAMVLAGGLGGWIVIWAAILAVKGTFEFQEAWKTYERNGSYPGV